MNRLPRDVLEYVLLFRETHRMQLKCILGSLQKDIIPEGVSNVETPDIPQVIMYQVKFRGYTILANTTYYQNSVLTTQICVKGPNQKTLGYYPFGGSFLPDSIELGSALIIGLFETILEDFDDFVQL
jgi:hypothetical protein